MINLYNCDCMDFMRGLPDKAYELAIVDPPYGIGKKLLNGGHNGTVRFHEHYAKNEWDNERPSKEYWNELFRVSSNQIVWGGNYFLDNLLPSRGIISWDKNLGSPYNFSHWEMAWTSFDTIAKRVVVSSNQRVSDHPTEKPVALYKWLLNNYANKGDKILDTHGGSMSIAIACYDLGFSLDLCELDPDYYAAGKQRLDDHIAKYAPASERPHTNKGELKLF